MIILGIDPGSRHFGYGFIDSTNMQLIFAGTINLPYQLEIPKRLKLIYENLDKKIELYKPHEIALEKAFAGKKIPSSFVLSYARAIAILIAAQRDIPIFEYSSTETKKALTGYGKAHKIQVRSMVKHFLRINGRLSYDCSDALAVAICHIHMKRLNFLNVK